MATNQNSNIGPKFNEYQAYEELRMIFVIAIETQNFSNIEARISAWEKKYPLADFTNPEIIRKIKAILNKDFLSRLIGDYLAAKVLHEQEKQKEAYNSLKAIIDKAKKSKDYKTATREIRKWKDNLYSNGLNLYGFDRTYRARICTLLLLPSKELKKQEQAADELKKIKENGSSMDSNEYFKAISDWQNTYSISEFPDKLKRELNEITAQVFDSISQKRTSENALLEVQNILSSKDISMPAEAIALALSKYDYRNFDRDTISQIERLNMEALSIQDSFLLNTDLSVFKQVSPVESQALSSLKDLLNKTPHDMDAILSWIYMNRKISYSEFARENIIKQFASVGYTIPNQSSFAIPEIASLDITDFSKVDDLRKTVILNYLGIISQGESLSSTGKDNLLDAHLASTGNKLAKEVQKPIMFLEAFDTVVEQEKEPEDDKMRDENEELIYNIFTEDIMDNPLATYSIMEPSKDSSENVTTSSTVPETTFTDKTSKEDVSESSETTSTSDNTDSGYLLTVQDEDNLEQAYELSTYVIIATPILEQALEPTLERPHRKQKVLEKTEE